MKIINGFMTAAIMTAAVLAASAGAVFPAGAEELSTGSLNGYDYNYEAGQYGTVDEWVTQEDGTALYCKTDALTGQVIETYNGWYRADSGEWYYFRKGAIATGWIIDNGKFYYLDTTTGIMAKDSHVGNFYVGEDGAALADTTAPDGTKLAYNGSRIVSKKTSDEAVEKLDDKTYLYREALVKRPDMFAEFSERSSGSYQIMPESENGFSWYTYATMKLYVRNEDGSFGDRVYNGDGCFSKDAVIEYIDTDGSVKTMKPSDLIGSGHEIWIAENIQIDPAGFITYSTIRK
ncbi:hypothetical protein [Oribacterium sp. WCC10]|uniref:hypothetical protein n=1 Tax=Oribacterium sp. WCC10 TaxID=1855343 RepID=UPI0008E11B3F|nr:hypothetical protein [Oribacterium sp. WCC10]SFG31731.1 Putative cell wall binding repeat-containing protein [Oribacterium sp. WCC10]